MTISTIDAILAASPAVSRNVTKNAEDGPYTVAGNIARRLVAAMSAGQPDGFKELFDAIEERLALASSEDRDLIVVGLLEDLQNVSLNRGVELDSWRPLLGPRTAEAWTVLVAMWAGRVTPTEFKTFIAQGLPPATTADG